MSSGYVVPTDASPDTAPAIMNNADATVEGFATVLAGKLEADISPIAEFDAVEDLQGGMINCRKSGPRSPCNKLVLVVIVPLDLVIRYCKSTVWPIEALCIRAFAFSYLTSVFSYMS